jgi:hypothetical protein
VITNNMKSLMDGCTKNTSLSSLDSLWQQGLLSAEDEENKSNCYAINFV